MKLSCSSILSVGLLMVLGVSCSREADSGPAVLATVGEQTITSEDFLREVERRRQARRPVPSKEALLQEMVTYESMLQRARQEGLTEDPEVRRELDNLIIGKLKERELMERLERITVLDEEIEAVYQADIDRYTQPAKFRFSVLHLKYGPKTSPAKLQELHARMEEAYRKALALPPRDGRDNSVPGFGSLALDYSDDQASRYRGGDVGWLDADRFDYRWPRELLETGHTLAPGEISRILTLDSGFYLIMKSDQRPGKTTPLAQVRAALAQKLKNQKRHEMMTAYQDESVELAGATIDADALATLTLTPQETSVVHNQIPSNPPALPSVGGLGPESRENGGRAQEF